MLDKRLYDILLIIIIYLKEESIAFLCELSGLNFDICIAEIIWKFGNVFKV